MLVSGPIIAKILSAGFNSPLDLLAGYHAGRLRITHLASKIAIVAKIYVYINWMSVSNAGLNKVSSPGALFKTVLKRLTKNYTFLIAF